jgi:hypothetical protein
LRRMDSNYRYRKDPVPHTRKWRSESVTAAYRKNYAYVCKPWL